MHIEQINHADFGTPPHSHRMKLGLGPYEVADIKMAHLQLDMLGTTDFYVLGLSTDPDEAEDLNEEAARNDPNFFAIYWSRQQVNTNGVLFSTKQMFTFPAPGITVAGDITMVLGASVATPINFMATIWYSRRKERKGERENLIMSRR